MKNPLISILVAAYNVEKYIDQCLDSIEKQSYKNIEVIIVDDFSSDDTKKICLEYTKKDSRFSLIEHDYNKGLLLVRKVAVNRASGEFSLFIDGDDFLNLDSLDKLVKLINENDCDIYRCSITVYGTNEKNKLKLESFFNKGPSYQASSIEILEDYFLRQSHSWNLCSSCFRTSILKEAYKYTRDEYLTSCEDGYASFLIAIHANTYIYDNTISFYSYRIGSGLTTRQTSIETFIKRTEEYKCIAWIKKYIEQSNVIEKKRVNDCLRKFEDALATSYVDRLTSLNLEEINLIFSSEYNLPCSNNIIYALACTAIKAKHKKSISKKIKLYFRNFFSSI